MSDLFQQLPVIYKTAIIGAPIGASLFVVGAVTIPRMLQYLRDTEAQIAVEMYRDPMKGPATIVTSDGISVRWTLTDNWVAQDGELTASGITWRKALKAFRKEHR